MRVSLSRGSHFRRLSGGAGMFMPALFLLVLAVFPVWGGDFPLISRLDARDPFFKQYQDDVERSRKLIFGRNKDRQSLAEGLLIYAYTLSADDDFLSLASRCTIPQASLATLNRIQHPSSLPKTILLPSVPGIFIPENPDNDLERLMAASRDSGEGIVITLNRGAQPERFVFFPGADFYPTERTCFFNTGFGFPLQNYRLTSSFGVRASPFTGRLQNHAGLDLAAPSGTSVYASREGTVSEAGYDSVYGNYVILAHSNNWASLYGHLSEITARVHAKVGRGAVIGKVGSTGQSTGPHLHFEIRKNGTAMDPGKLLFKRN